MNFDERQFRNALGRFATGVCVVCGNNPESKPVGMTINSFSSLSLNPALVLWSIKRNSLSYQIFSELDRYSINILAEAQLDVSRRYARAGDHLMIAEDVKYSKGKLPYIDGAIARFECDKWSSVSAGDHDILIGRVADYHSESDRVPAIYFEGSYRMLDTL